MGKFVKGQSGNPSGKPRNDVSIRAVLRDHQDEVIARLLAVMRGADDGKALEAIKVILDRAYGRPVQVVDGDGEGGPVKITVEWLTPEA